MAYGRKRKAARKAPRRGRAARSTGYSTRRVRRPAKRSGGRSRKSVSRTQTVRLEIIQTPGTALTNPLVAAGAVPTKEVPPRRARF